MYGVYVVVHQDFGLANTSMQVRNTEEQAIQFIFWVMGSKLRFYRAFKLDENGTVTGLDFSIEGGRPTLTEVETFGTEAEIDESGIGEIMRSVRIHRPTNEWILSKGQWSALLGWTTKWRKAARFWEAEARRLGSQAVYKIREKELPKDGETEGVETTEI